MTLLPFPGFVARNRLPSAATQSVPVRPLPDSPALCPVRALSIYLDRTAGVRPESSPLFLSLNQPGTPIRSSLISLWIRQTIVCAYKWCAAQSSQAPLDQATPPSRFGTRLLSHDCCGVSRTVFRRDHVDRLCSTLTSVSGRATSDTKPLGALGGSSRPSSDTDYDGPQSVHTPSGPTAHGDATPPHEQYGAQVTGSSPRSPSAATHGTPGDSASPALLPPALTRPPTSSEPLRRPSPSAGASPTPR